MSAADLESAEFWRDCTARSLAKYLLDGGDRGSVLDARLELYAEAVERVEAVERAAAANLRA